MEVHEIESPLFRGSRTETGHVDAPSPCSTAFQRAQPEAGSCVVAVVTRARFHHWCNPATAFNGNAAAPRQSGPRRRPTRRTCAGSVDWCTAGYIRTVVQNRHASDCLDRVTGNRVGGDERCPVTGPPASPNRRNRREVRNSRSPRGAQASPASTSQVRFRGLARERWWSRHCVRSRTSTTSPGRTAALASEISLVRRRTAGQALARRTTTPILLSVRFCWWRML